MAGSIFDPLGFLVPFVLTAKEILQDLCRTKLGWDDEIPDELVSRSSKALNFYRKSLKSTDFGRVKSSPPRPFLYARARSSREN